MHDACMHACKHVSVRILVLLSGSATAPSGGVVMLNGGPIAWFSVLGKTVATSTCEAEVNAAVVAAKDAVHIQRILVDLGVCDGTQP